MNILPSLQIAVVYLVLCSAADDASLRCHGVSDVYVDPVTHVRHPCSGICGRSDWHYLQYCKAYCSKYYECRQVSAIEPNIFTSETTTVIIVEGKGSASPFQETSAGLRTGITVAIVTAATVVVLACMLAITLAIVKYVKFRRRRNTPNVPPDEPEEIELALTSHSPLNTEIEFRPPRTRRTKRLSETGALLEVTGPSVVEEVCAATLPMVSGPSGISLGIQGDITAAINDEIAEDSANESALLMHDRSDDVTNDVNKGQHLASSVQLRTPVQESLPPYETPVQESLLAYETPVQESSLAYQTPVQESLPPHEDTSVFQDPLFTEAQHLSAAFSSAFDFQSHEDQGEMRNNLGDDHLPRHRPKRQSHVTSSGNLYAVSNSEVLRDAKINHSTASTSRKVIDPEYSERHFNPSGDILDDFPSSHPSGPDAPRRRDGSPSVDILGNPRERLQQSVVDYPGSLSDPEANPASARFTATSVPDGPHGEADNDGDGACPYQDDLCLTGSSTTEDYYDDDDDDDDHEDDNDAATTERKMMYSS